MLRVSSCPADTILVRDLDIAHVHCIHSRRRRDTRTHTSQSTQHDMRKGLKHSMIHIFCLRLVSDMQPSRPACCHHSVSYVILHDRQHGKIPPNLGCLGLDVVWCQRVFAPVALGSSRSRKSVPVVFVVTSKIAGAGSSLVEPSLMVERCSDSSKSARVDPQVYSSSHGFSDVLHAIQSLLVA